MELPPLVCIVQHFSLLMGRAWAASQEASQQHHAGNLAPGSSGFERVLPSGKSSASHSPSKAASKQSCPALVSCERISATLSQPATNPAAPGESCHGSTGQMAQVMDNATQRWVLQLLASQYSR